jgi:seryl-tRNA synthetase
MIDIKDLRENPEKYRKGAELKGVDVEVSRIIDLDEQRVRAQQEFETLRAEQNKQSKEIAKIKDPAAKKEAIAKMGELAGQVKQAEERFKTADAAVQPLLLQIPQPPDEDVPVGKDAT